MQIESDQLLAGSGTPPIKATVDGGEELEYGGETKKDQPYDPW